MSVLELCLTSGGNEKKMRGVKVDGEEERWSVYDFINAVCCRPVRDTYGRNTYYDLVASGSDYKTEVAGLTCNLKFPGRGQRDTPCMTLKGLQTLLTMLGGKVAAEYRALVVDTFNRVMAGDRSLIKVIEANATSTAPIQQAFKRSLAEEPAAPTLERMCGLSSDEKALENRKRQIELDLMESDAAQKRLHVHRDRLEFIKSLSPNGVVDDQVRMMFKDSVLNSMRNDMGQGFAAPDPSMQPVCLSSVAIELGFKFDKDNLKDIGKLLKIAYVDAYGTDPGKHQAMVEGNMRDVNLYTRKDVPMIKKTMSDFHAKLKMAGHSKTLAQCWNV